MLTERLHTSNSSFIDRLLAVDYFLIFIVVAIGAISVFAIHSTEGGEFSYFTKNHLIRLVTFFFMFLILSFVTRNIINIPLIWIIEMAQFVMTGYYLLGGGYSMLTDDHVRMDLIYSKLKDRTKAILDSITSVFLITYLVILLIGAYSSLEYTIQTNQRLFTAWAPYVWPIKSLMLIGI